MTSRTFVILCLLGVVAVGGCGDGDDDVTVKDFSRGLVRFEYALSPALGFCVQSGDVLRAEIAAAADGTMTVAASVAEQGMRGRDDCLPMVTSGSCLVTRAIAERPLTVAEMDEVRATFRSVRIATESAPGCGIDDPCTERHFTWTRHLGNGERTARAGDGSCAPFLADSDVHDVKALLTHLLLAPG